MSLFSRSETFQNLAERISATAAEKKYDPDHTVTSASAATKDTVTAASTAVVVISAAAE